MASSELLKQIQAGRKLKHSETNDRSAPQVDTPKSFGGSKGSSGPPSSVLGGGFGGGAPQPGSLFAGGIPKLKPAGQSKHGNFAKPPPIRKSDPTPPNVPTPRTSVPAVPARPVPSGKNDTSSTPLLPRRDPPVIRSESPSVTTQSSVSSASPSRSIAAVPFRNVTSTKPTPDRVPPPPPRSSHVTVAPSPGRAPQPPGRKPPSVTRTYSPDPDSSSVPPSTISRLPPPSRRLPLASANGDKLLARRKIPSPPPNTGVHTFQVTGFPPPRDFKNTSKIYKSGNQRGSYFDLSSL